MITRPDTILSTYMQKRFMAWCEDQGSGIGAAAALADELFERYEEPQRFYHHLGHIAGSLGEFDLHARGHSLLEGAIWFHDVIYDPTRSDNEAASVRWFREQTQGWIDATHAERISRLIEVTDFRIKPEETPEAALMADIDLAILSAGAEEYDAYSRAIHLEYSHVPSQAFREGRAKVMEHFLSQPIYRTAGFLPREERARQNISRELERLANR